MPDRIPKDIPLPEFATSVRPSDTSTSIVIHPDPAKQIRDGDARITTFADVPFGKQPSPGGSEIELKMDILVPETAGRKPLVVFVAGGGFIFVAKQSCLNLRAYLAEAGFVVASIEYRTVRDGATYREGLADVKSAIRFLRSHADRYGIDPTHVGVWGQSAGGYLAAMAGVTSGDRAFDIGDRLDQSSGVKAVVDQFGPSDLSKVDADFNDEKRRSAGPDRRSLYANGFLPGNEGLCDPASSPMNHRVSPGVAFRLFHGSQDRLISPSQTLMLHETLLAAGVDSKRYVLEGANHGDLSFLGDRASGLTWSSTDTMDIVVEFFSTELRV